MAAIKYQNIPFKMPRTDVGGSKFYYMPANSVTINHSAKLNRYRLLAANSLPETRLVAPFETKIQASFPICNKFANDQSTGDSFNFASGVLSMLTGESGANIYIGHEAQIFSGCYLDSLSIQLEPFQSAVMTIDLTCTNPPTGFQFSGTNSFVSPTGLSQKFAYGHLAEIVSGEAFSDSNQSSISYNIDCSRTYSFALSSTKKTAENIFLDEVTKKLSIKATNIADFITETGLASFIQVNLKNELNELILPSGSISISQNGRLNAQSLNIAAGGFLNADITIEEGIL